MLNTPEKKALHNSLMPPEDRKFDSHAEGAKAEQSAETKSRPAGPAPAKNPLPAAWSTVELFDYPGTIELGAIMLQRGVIPFDELYNQFGYRVANLSCKAEIIYRVENDIEYYETFLFAKEEVEKHRAAGGGEITIIRPYGNGGHPPCETSAVVALAERHRGSGFVYEDTLSYRQFSVPHTRPVPKRRKEFTIIYCNTITTYNISDTQNVFRIYYNISLQ